MPFHEMELSLANVTNVDNSVARSGRGSWMGAMFSRTAQAHRILSSASHTHQAHRTHIRRIAHTPGASHTHQAHRTHIRQQPRSELLKTAAAGPHRILSSASLALEISSRRKISLLLRREGRDHVCAFFSTEKAHRAAVQRKQPLGDSRAGRLGLQHRLAGIPDCRGCIWVARCNGLLSLTSRRC